jgi:hypothetical protein
MIARNVTHGRVKSNRPSGNEKVRHEPWQPRGDVAAHRGISDFSLVSNELRSARLAAHVCSLLKCAVAGSPQRIAFLEESSSDYMQLIRTFEADRVELQRRLATADAADAARLEQGLRVNQRGLELLQNALARIKAELAQERSKPDP